MSWSILMYFYHYFPRNSWYSFDQPRKDERLSLPWSHQVVSNSRPLDWESSALTTMSLAQKMLYLLPLMNSFNSSVNHPITLTWCSLEAKPWQKTFSKASEIPRNTPQTSRPISNTLLILYLIGKSSLIEVYQ